MDLLNRKPQPKGLLQKWAALKHYSSKGIDKELQPTGSDRTITHRVWSTKKSKWAWRRKSQSSKSIVDKKP